jgi:tRNA threonylcarbamoyladenosine modification (KEOPS) complex Cgi121 subunit
MLSIDRKKALQTATLKAVRAMRTVLCRTLRQEIILRAASEMSSL